MYDVCIVGSGAGASPIAYELTKAGFKVVVLEKGDFYKEEDFSKDEIAYCRRSIVTPNLYKEYHLVEEFEDGKWKKTPTFKSKWDFFNGNIVGGASNFMSGYFHRLHPKDFRLLSEFKAIKGANIANWPITYQELEPYYEKVERVVGISGEVSYYPFLEPRSTKNFPYPPLKEHPIASFIDKTCKKMGINPVKTPRAILSKPNGKRNSCYYSNFCGSYGCSSGAKSSARAALLQKIINKKNFTLKIFSHVTKFTAKKDYVKEVEYIDLKAKKVKTIRAKLFVLAAGAIESSRILLNSKSGYFPNGLANNSKNVGKNLIFSAGGVVTAEIDEDVMDLRDLMIKGLFINRSIKDWYFIEDKKGGICDILFEHENPILRANRVKYQNEKLLWGEELYKKIYERFNKKRVLNCEIFNDWLPNDNCFVSVDPNYKDIYQMPVAKIRIFSHKHNQKIGNILADKCIFFLKELGAKNIEKFITPYPPTNLQAGGIRFGNDPKKSVLDKNCKAHEVKNLFVTDGSFMPTGGSVPFTWTIYANSFRVADFIKKEFSF